MTQRLSSCRAAALHQQRVHLVQQSRRLLMPRLWRRRRCKKSEELR